MYRKKIKSTIWAFLLLLAIITLMGCDKAPEPIPVAQLEAMEEAEIVASSELPDGESALSCSERQRYYIRSASPAVEIYCPEGDGSDGIPAGIHAYTCESGEHPFVAPSAPRTIRIMCPPASGDPTETPTTTATSTSTPTATIDDTPVPPTHTATPTIQPNLSLVPFPGHGLFYSAGANQGWFDGGYGSTYPTVEQWNQHTYDGLYAETMFAQMAQDGHNTLRVLVFADGRGAEWDATGRFTGLDATTIPTMIDLLNRAETHGIHVVFTLFDFSLAFASGSGGITGDRADIVNNPVVTQSFIDNGLRPILQAMGNHPALLGFDPINEPDFAVSEFGTAPEVVDPFSLASLQRYIAMVAHEIHVESDALVMQSFGSIRFISSGCLGCAGDFFTDEILTALAPAGYIDVLQPHYYAWMNGNGTTWNYNPFDYSHAQLGFNKPVVLGEVASVSTYTHQDALDKGYAGIWYWSYGTNIDSAGSWANVPASSKSWALANPQLTCVVCGTLPTSTPTSTPTPLPTVTSTATIGPTVTIQPPTPALTPTPSPTPILDDTSFYDGFGVATTPGMAP